MKMSSLQRSLTQNDWCPYKKRKIQTGGISCNNRGKNCSDDETCQLRPRIAGKHQKLGADWEREDLVLELWREHSLAGTLIFQNCERINF